MAKTYDIVLKLLQTYPVTRNSDKALIWRFWMYQGHILGASKESYINWMNFASARSPESITRARRKAQELHPELGADRPIEQNRRKKAEQKGTFIFREQ